MSTKKLMKDYYDKDLAERYAENISQVYPEFDSKAFVDNTVIKIEDGRMSERIQVFSEQLREYLPNDYSRAIDIIIEVLGEENEEFYFPVEKTHYFRALSKFIEMYGQEDFDQSIKAMEEITKRHSSEFAVRPFILNNYEKMEKVLKRWEVSNDAHLRRLVTEGTRPRLPWAKKLPYLKNDVNENLKILKPFLNDPSRYVEKSAANHLNDISKEYPDKVIAFLKAHMNQTSPFIIRRALRTLKKAEDTQALSLLQELK